MTGASAAVVVAAVVVVVAVVDARVVADDDVSLEDVMPSPLLPAPQPATARSANVMQEAPASRSCRENLFTILLNLS